MPGYNHYDDCTCGWCAGGGGNSWRYWSFDSRGPVWPGVEATERSFTDPNAKCPVCGAAVFFYQSPYGGRVFFDEMGPPWPKHPCTDNPRLNIQRVPYISSATNRTPSWQAGGWEPALIFHVEKMRDWALIRLRRPNQNGFLVRATPWRDSIKIGIPAHIKSLDSYVLGLISILAPGVTKFEPIEQVLAHRSMVACRLLTIRLARKGDAASAHRVALSSYKAWGKANSATGMVEYPLYVDLNIARKWLEQAASLGSSEAKMILDRDFDPVTT